MRRLAAVLLARLRRARPSEPTAPEAPPRRSDAVDAEALVRRRAAIRRWWESSRDPTPADAVGLALSGGGIRSATFSLGALQALARRDRLRAIDVLSTVSGGSYVGCFLRSLFMPQARRGIAPPEGSLAAADVRGRYSFAMDALRSEANERALKSPDGLRVRNPIWWLREHSRYLAPNGATDYGYAVAYLARNWVGMLYVFALGMAGVLAATALLDAGVVHLLKVNGLHWIRLAGAPAAPPTGCDLHLPLSARVVGAAVCDGPRPVAAPPLIASPSPLFLLAIVPQVASLGTSMAYWLTCQMSPNEPSVPRQVGSYLALATAAWVALAALLSPLAWAAWPAAAHVIETEAATASLFALELAVGLVFFLAALAWSSPHQLLTAEFRRRLTQAQATCNLLVLVLLGLGVVETLAAGLRAWFWTEAGTRSALSLATLPPVLAYAIQRLQRLAAGAGAKGGWMSVAARFLPAVAFLAGVALYGAVAVVAGALVDAAMWDHDAWLGTFDGRSTVLLLAALGSLGLLTGRSTGFINLSSLHTLYASRLTRAYLGATNERRLRSLEDREEPDVTIRDNHYLDYIQPEIYGREDLPAPLHVINVTANRTIDESSSLVARDRKGELLSVEPHGVRLGSGHDRTFLTWKEIGGRKAESLSLGQWCAISGAAASSGMGRLTNLGYAIVLTFANVRLGYWWWVPAGRPPRPTLPRWRRTKAGAVAFLYRLLSTFFYLFDEMTARYSRGYDRQYLSDGGHFENTGAYALIRRDVPRILVCDNAQDQDYAFADLENLVRKVRLDLGREMRLLSGAALRSFAATVGCPQPAVFVDAEADPDWKASLRAGKGEAFALAFEIRGRLPFGGGEALLHLVLVKPRLLPDMPQDVAGYAVANPPFPQQTTGDQFFDEAQWESYRRLGQHCMGKLLDACPRLFGTRDEPFRA